MMLCPETVSLLGVKQYFDEQPGTPLMLLAWVTTVLLHDWLQKWQHGRQHRMLRICAPTCSFAGVPEGLEGAELQGAKVQRLLRVLSSTTFHQVRAAVPGICWRGFIA